MASDTWIELNGNWYYFGSDGDMVRNSWMGNYYLLSNGMMAQNQYIDGYWVGDDGEYDAGYENENYETVATSPKSLSGDSTSDTQNDAASSQIDNTNLSEKQQEVSLLTLSNHTSIEGEYNVGTTIPLTGIITSNYTVTSVTIDLKMTYLGEYHYTKTYDVNSKVIDLEEMDLGYFDTRVLTMSGAGYCFTIHAEDSSGASRELSKEYFKMKYKERLHYSFDNYEKIGASVTEGFDYETNGTIRGNYPISKVQVTLTSSKDGTKIGREIVNPHTYEYDLGDLDGMFDFTSLVPGRYHYYASAHIGEEIKTLINERFEVKAKSSSNGDAVMYAINACFGRNENGVSLSTNGSRSFTERILWGAFKRVKKKYSNAHPYVEFSRDNEATDFERNWVYAHSDGIVKHSGNGSVEIEHKGGYTIRYEGFNKEDICVEKGKAVDENTTVGIMPKNKTVKIYLLDHEQNKLNVMDYIDSNFY